MEKKPPAASSGISWDVAADCSRLLPPVPSFGARATALWVKTLLGSGPTLHTVWTHSFGADVFLHRQEIGKLVGNM